MICGSGTKGIRNRKPHQVISIISYWVAGEASSSVVSTRGLTNSNHNIIHGLRRRPHQLKFIRVVSQHSRFSNYDQCSTATQWVVLSRV